MYCSARTIIFTTLLIVPAIQAEQSKRPDLPFFDWNACPFEGCSYRQWTARKPVAVYDTWKHARRPVAQLAMGDKVGAITGVVITYKPGVIRMDHDLPQEGLKRGDIILTYVYRGEGSEAAWFNGAYHDYFDVPSKRPDGQGCVEDCAATYLILGKRSGGPR